MGQPEHSRFCNVIPTIWGDEIRVVLTAKESQDLRFIMRFSDDSAQMAEAIGAAVGVALRQLAWQIADFVQVFPGGGLPGSGPAGG